MPFVLGLPEFIPGEVYVLTVQGTDVFEGTDTEFLSFEIQRKYILK